MIEENDSALPKNKDFKNNEAFFLKIKIRKIIKCFYMFLE